MYKVSNPPAVHTISGEDGIGPEKSIICNEPKVNDWMIQEGKHKIQHLKQLGTISPEVMEKLHDIMKPIDERKTFQSYFK